MIVAETVIPFLMVRVIYLVLVEFGPVKFSPLLGDWRYQAGMAFVMEVAIMVLLIVGRAIIQPLTAWKDGEAALPNRHEDVTVSADNEYQV